MKFKNIFFLTILITFIHQNILALENKILFKNDDEIVSSIDIYNKTKYLRALNQNMENLDKNEIYELSKNLIIREKINKIFLFILNLSLKIKKKISGRKLQKKI